ncbi:MAG: hypothetical protein EKK42_20205 [Pseudonocardiaceae bacterium]|nr:MAG: hypothetical protein EKK42_20205 [Pseudonocardiaceae bacterium]
MSNERAMTSNDSWGGRTYTHPITGEEFRSVTTILGAQNKPQLNNWKVKTVANYAADNLELLSKMDRDEAADLIRSSQYTSSREAADIGSEVHAIIENLALGNSVIVPRGGQYVVKMWEELNQEFEIQVLHTEATMINRTVGYAGSADLMVMIRKRGSGAPFKRAIVDAKSGKSIYDSVSLQLVAYAKSENILLPSGDELPMPPIQETYALHVRPRSWALIPMRYDVAAWATFQSLVVVDRWINKESRTAVGRAINAGAIARMRSAA